MADKVLNTPFNRTIMQSAPSPKANGTGHFNKHNSPVVGKPATPGVVDFKFYEDGPSLDHSPAALSSPMGTAIPNIGHGFTGGK